MRVVVTGGTGYIGSHTVVELIEAGHTVLVIDSLDNSSVEVLDNIELITNVRPAFLEADIRDQESIVRFLRQQSCEAVIHFAALKAVSESVAEPLKYYENNVAGFISLLQAVQICGIQRFIFSSSAAVYGNPPNPTIIEDTPCQPTSPYGWSKQMCEVILRDTCTATKELSGTALRYFNVVGAHDSGLLGESPKTKPQNLLPIIVQAVQGDIPPLTVMGTDYPTPDGTCLRDYIHVTDLARAHVDALAYQVRNNKPDYTVFNIGTGVPTSVLELITIFERVNGVAVPYLLGDRRIGDPVASYASVEKAKKTLNWQAKKTLEDAVRDAWCWQKRLNGLSNEKKIT